MSKFTSKRGLQTGSFITLLLIATTIGQSPPGSPVITAPDIIIKDQTVTLTCTVTGGNPAPTVRWLKDDNVIDDSYTQSGGSYVNQYTFVASDADHLEVFECQSENGVLQNPLSRTIFVQVYRTPQTPTLTGPTNVLSGSSNQWTCTSLAGFPAPTMQIRIENAVFPSNQVTTNTVFDAAAKSYAVTSVLTWSPTTANNGQRLFCDVFHPETRGANNPQTVSLPLTVQSPLSVNAPITAYNPTVGDTISINCVVTSGIANSITWFKNNQPVSINNVARLSGGVPNNPSLVVSQVQTGDAGNYQCQATDGTATVATNVITVTVRVPLSVNAPVTAYNPTVGDTLSINCVVTSGTATSITWFKNNQAVSINNDARLSGGIPNSPSLVISDVQTGDAGSYQCQATDATSNAGTNVISVTVRVPDVTEEVIITTILTGYNKLVRPTPSPNVIHSMHPTRIASCDMGTLVLQGYTCMSWYDQRLTWTVGQASVSLPSDYIWLPDVAQHGEKPDFYSAPVWSAEKAVVTKDGTVTFCPQGLFTTKNCVEKAGEKHQCSMKFRSWTYDRELMDINLPVGREAVDLSALEVHDKCELVNKCAVRAENTYACCGNRVYPDITYTVVWQRKRNYCVNLSEQSTCNA